MILSHLKKSTSPAIDGEVTILIPTMFDSRFVIELCIKSILKNTSYPTFNIIVADAGVDEETGDYLKSLHEKSVIRLIKAKDWQRPKDDLAEAVTTKYYSIMHDDIYIKHKDWLSRRMRLMLADPSNAIVGSLVPNYKTNGKRFFPMGMLVRTEAARALDIKWGKQVEQGYDTGALAYIKFQQQNHYKFVSYKTTTDIHHFSSMTWPKYKDMNDPKIQKLLAERDIKLNMIREMLRTGNF